MTSNQVLLKKCTPSSDRAYRIPQPMVSQTLRASGWSDLTIATYGIKSELSGDVRCHQACILNLEAHEEPLEHAELGEENGVRTKRRMEQHLLSANLVTDIRMLANKPKVKVKLSKAVDRVD